MTAAVLTILAALAGLLVWWVRRRSAQADDPLEQHRKRYAQIDEDIAGGDGAAAGAHAADDLDELDRRLRHQNGGDPE